MPVHSQFPSFNIIKKKQRSSYINCLMLSLADKIGFYLDVCFENEDQKYENIMNTTCQSTIKLKL